jgi:hypothetical protein
VEGYILVLYAVFSFSLVFLFNSESLPLTTVLYFLKMDTRLPIMYCHVLPLERCS